MIDQDNKIVGFAVLDYNKPKETRILLESLKKHIKLKKYHPRVVLLSNGGQQDYILQFYQEGLIDELILKKDNVGTGYGTIDLMMYLNRTDQAFYIQNDHALICDITDEIIDKFNELLENCQKYSHIDVSGNQGNGIYSERAQYVRTKFYNGIPKSGGGPGPYSHLKWSEQSIQEFCKEKGLGFIVTPIFFANIGKWSVRQWECGTETRHRTDTKELEFTKLPKNGLSQTLIDFYSLTKDEVDVILNGNWGFQIPENRKNDSFLIPQWENL